MKHSLGEIISWVTNQVLVNLRKLKSYQDLFRPQRYEFRYKLQGQTVKNTNTWRLNNTLLNNQEVTG